MPWALKTDISTSEGSANSKLATRELP